MIAMIDKTMGTVTPTPMAALAPVERPDGPESVVVVTEAAEAEDGPATTSTAEERAAIEAEAEDLVMMTRFSIVGSTAAAETLQEASDVGHEILVYVGV